MNINEFEIVCSINDVISQYEYSDDVILYIKPILNKDEVIGIKMLCHARNCYNIFSHDIIIEDIYKIKNYEDYFKEIVLELIEKCRNI